MAQTSKNSREEEKKKNSHLVAAAAFGHVPPPPRLVDEGETVKRAHDAAVRGVDDALETKTKKSRGVSDGVGLGRLGAATPAHTPIHAHLGRVSLADEGDEERGVLRRRVARPAALPAALHRPRRRGGGGLRGCRRAVAVAGGGGGRRVGRRARHDVAGAGVRRGGRRRRDPVARGGSVGDRARGGGALVARGGEGGERRAVVAAAAAALAPVAVARGRRPLAVRVEEEDPLVAAHGEALGRDRFAWRGGARRGGWGGGRARRHGRLPPSPPPRHPPTHRRRCP
jgi:hypothetical protein